MADFVSFRLMLKDDSRTNRHHPSSKLEEVKRKTGKMWVLPSLFFEVAFLGSLPKRLAFRLHWPELCPMGPLIVNIGYALPTTSTAWQAS